MPVRSREPEFRIDNPSALIRARIREKRIFEARFLCRQLGSELGTMEKSALEGELARIMAQVDKLRKQAIAYAGAGKLQLAAKVYREIERIAVDVPDLAAERQRIDGAEAVLTRVTNGAVHRGTAAAIPSPPPDPAGMGKSPLAVRPPARMARLIRLSRRQLAVLFVGLLVLVGLLAYVLRRDQAPTQAAPTAIGQPASRIVIRPVVSSSPQPVLQPEEAAPAEEPSPESPLARSGSLTIGELQVQPAVKE
jgi:hypothetical protein